MSGVVASKADDTANALFALASRLRWWARETAPADPIPPVVCRHSGYGWADRTKLLVRRRWAMFRALRESAYPLLSLLWRDSSLPTSAALPRITGAAVGVTNVHWSNVERGVAPVTLELAAAVERVYGLCPLLLARLVAAPQSVSAHVREARAVVRTLHP